MKKNKRCVVLLSGGQDSTTCLFWAIEQFGRKNVFAIGFDYGQKHKVELEFAAEIADRAEVPFYVVPIVGTLSGSSLTDHDKDSNAQHEKNGDLPASFTAGRNMLFLSLAAAFASSIDAFDIVTGVCQTDFSGYPDCRRVFIDSMQTTISLAMGRSDDDYRIHTPLMYITKAETWKLAYDLGYKLNYDVVDLIINHTLTDYNGSTAMNEWGMGTLDNPASKLRAKGYFEAKEKGWI
jgi:7-cyano-7-deazaguanine synthase